MHDARQLEEFARDIRQYGYPIVDGTVLKQAQERLSTQQMPPAASRLPSSVQPAQERRPPTRNTTVTVGTIKTALHRNPFFVLGATVHDDSRRILELADERALMLDSAVCAKARADLTIPRNRLAAELAWLPGVPPEKVTEVLEGLRDNVDSEFYRGMSSWLAGANLTAAALELIDAESDVKIWSSQISKLAAYESLIEPENELEIINESREIAGFPTVKAIELVEAELAERRRYYKDQIKGALNRLPSAKLVEVITKVVESEKAEAEKIDEDAELTSRLIDDVVDSYEVDAGSALQKGVENIKKIIEATAAAAPKGVSVVKTFVDALEDALAKWNRIARPIQLSRKARGLDHDASRQVAIAVRSLGVDLFNKHDMLEMSGRLVKIVAQMSSVLPEVKELVEEDTKALRGIVSGRQEARKNAEKWAQEITYEAEVGLVFKTTLRISPDGIQWDKAKYPLDAITGVRWGGISHSINGIPTGTTYTIAFCNASAISVVETRRQEVYQNFTNRLWKAVCTRILVEHLEALKSGKTVKFGDAVIDDAGVQLVKHKFFGNEQLYCPWGNTRHWTADGALNIRSEDDKNAYTSLSFINVWNVHILEAIIRLSFEKWTGRLSGLINS